MLSEQLVEEGALYAHYKDPQSPYRVIGFAILEATEEPCVIYRKDSAETMTWVRPLQSWLETVLYEGKQVPRFQKVEK